MTLVLDVPLGIGFTAETFHSVGSSPFFSERLKMMVTPLTIEWAVFFNMFADIPSGAFALVTSREYNKFKTSSSEQSRSSGNSLELVFW